MKERIMLVTALAIALTVISVVAVPTLGSEQEVTTPIDDYEVTMLSANNTTLPIANVQYVAPKMTDVHVSAITDIVAIDNTWIDKNDSTIVKETISNILNDNKAVVLFESLKYFESKTSIKFPLSLDIDDCDATVIHLKSDGTFEIKMISGYNEIDTANLALSWAKTICSDTESGPVNQMANNSADSTQSYWRELGAVTIDKSFGNKGDMSITYDVSQLYNHVMTDREYFIIHYCQNANPNLNNNYRLADILLRQSETITASIDLIETKPEDTVGTSTSSTTVSFDISGEYPWGVSVGGGVSKTWEYSIPDVTISNESNLGQNITHIWHDVDQEKGVGKGYTAEPGVKLALFGGSGSFIDMHQMTTCTFDDGIIFDKYENYSTDTFNVKVTLTADNPTIVEHL